MFSSRMGPLFLAGFAAGLLILVLTVAAGATGPATTCTVPGNHATIQAAVDDPNCEFIDVTAGTFTENVTIGLSRTVTIQGQGALSTTVDGADLGSVFEVQAGAAVTLTGLTITGGDSAQGGGIRNSGSLTVTSSSISGNWGAWGGGI